MIDVDEAHLRLAHAGKEEPTSDGTHEIYRMQCDDDDDVEEEEERYSRRPTEKMNGLERRRRR